MSLPIILAIVLTAAILAWGAVYLVVRQRREAALKRMFQADPMDAEIGREALRRVFGILADEDPPTPLAATRPVLPSMASSESPPVALGPAGAALGSAGRSAAVAPPSLSRTDSRTDASPPAVPAVMPLPVAASLAAAASVEPAPAPPKSRFRLFAPDDADALSMAVATPLLAGQGAGSGNLGTHLPAPVVPGRTTTGSAGAKRRTAGAHRPRFIRDGVGAVLVVGGIVVLLVAIMDPHLSILSGGVLPATATAPAIALVSPTPVASPTFSLVPTASPSASPSSSPSFGPSPSPTPLITPRPTERPTPVPTPVPTPFPTATPKPTPKPTPTPLPPVVLTFTAAPSVVVVGATVTFNASWIRGTSWRIDYGDLTPTSWVNGTGPITINHVYLTPGNYVARFFVRAGSQISNPGSAPVDVTN